MRIAYCKLTQYKRSIDAEMREFRNVGAKERRFEMVRLPKGEGR